MTDEAAVSDEREEVARAARELGLPESRFRILSPTEAAPVLADIEARFVARAGRRWWWEAFRDAPTARAHFPDGSGWERLAEIVPPDTGPVWLVVEGEPAFTVCAGTVDAARAVIGACRPFEYYVVSPALDWLVCENHSDVVYAVGEAVAGRLATAA